MRKVRVVSEGLHNVTDLESLIEVVNSYRKSDLVGLPGGSSQLRTGSSVSFAAEKLIR